MSASVVSVLGQSHSPLWGVTPPATEADSGSTFVHGTSRARDLLSSQGVSAAVIFGPDHFRFAFYDLMPPFCIGVQEVIGAGDYNSPGGELPVAQELARHLHDEVCAAGFDPALSLRMGVDHGIAQTYGAMFPQLDVPFVPVMVNTSAPPLPSLRRCFEFGQAVGRAIAGFDSGDRVAVIGSGGLSHWPPKLQPDAPGTTERDRDFLLGDRTQLGQRETARQRRVAAMGEANGAINSQWDEWVLDCLQNGDLEALLGLDEETIERDGGNGGQEIRTWVAALGAYLGSGASVAQTAFDRAYEPVPRWITGMGSLVGVRNDIRTTQEA